MLNLFLYWMLLFNELFIYRVSINFGKAQDCN